ncbi:MAG TPA: ABC transporter permease subunit [Terracidiphilus sp.]|jgi:peptide/nickel transport system permease protein|nr:ABC transporter permease subunit [Terracidiphilus sp.]
MKAAAAVARWLARTLAIVLLVIVGSTVLVRFAPGYLSDAREMDSRYGDSVRAEIAAEAARSSSLTHLLSVELRGWMHGDGGVSRQYGVPVSELILPRLAVTGGLILRALILAWTLALCASLLSSAARKPSMLWQAPAALLLAVPTAAMATLCLLAGYGGPVLVMALLLTARDYKFLHHTLRKAWLDPHLLQARAQGVRAHRLIVGYILPSIGPQLSALASLSIVTALSALVPVEVIFNVPGLGELAWNAALNRDLPVLLSATIIMALAVTLAGLASDRPSEWRSA